MRAAIYARYSSDKQTEQSIEGQLRICTQYCESNGIEIVDTYIDRALSASKNTEKRVEFLRMIKESDRKLWDIVVVYKLDRFARDRYDSAIYKTKLKKNGVRVVSATENISDNPEGIILESVLEGMAEFYSKELSQKVSRGMHESALKCNSTGGTIPIGYKIGEDKKLHIDPYYADIVKEAFKLYAAGRTVKQICDKFNEQGYTTAKGRPFGHNSFKTVFSNKKYIGIYTYNNEVEIKGGVPAIIDEDTFNKVQERLKQNAKNPSRGRATTDYLLISKLFCGHCGKPMGAESANKKGERYYYYACSGKKRFRNCDKKNIRKDIIEEAVYRDTISAFTPEVIDQIAETVTRYIESDKASNTTIMAIKSRQREIDVSIQGIMKAIELGSVSETLVKRLDELEKEKIHLATKQKREETSYPYLNKPRIAFWLQSLLSDSCKESPDYKQVIIDVLVNSVYVYDNPDGDHKIVIAYNLPGKEKTTILLSDVEKAFDSCDGWLTKQKDTQMGVFFVCHRRKSKRL